MPNVETPFAKGSLAMQDEEKGERHLKPGASVVVFRGAEVLLIRRGKKPFEGFWSFPGGAIQWGETAEAAARRELEEETGLLASTLTLGDVAEGILKDGMGEVTTHYLVIVFATRDVDGVPVAASDADSVGFFGPEDRARLQLTPGLEAVIANAGRRLDRGGS